MGVAVCVERRPNTLEVNAVFEWPSAKVGGRLVAAMLGRVRDAKVDPITESAA